MTPPTDPLERLRAQRPDVAPAAAPPPLSDLLTSDSTAATPLSVADRPPRRWWNRTGLMVAATAAASAAVIAGGSIVFSGNQSGSAGPSDSITTGSASASDSAPSSESSSSDPSASPSGADSSGAATTTAAAPTTPSPTTPLPPLSGSVSEQLLQLSERAADYTVPGQGEVLYQRIQYGGILIAHGGNGNELMDPITGISEQWKYGPNGNSATRSDDYPYEVNPGNFPSLPECAPDVTAEQIDALTNWRTYPNSTEMLRRILSGCAADGIDPGHATSVILAEFAQQPDVTLDSNYVDAAGRPAIGIIVKGEFPDGNGYPGGLSFQITVALDPNTGMMLEDKSTVTRDPKNPDRVPYDDSVSTYLLISKVPALGDTPQ